MSAARRKQAQGEEGEMTFEQAMGRLEDAEAAPRAPATSCVVASGAAGSPARALAMSWAVWVAVPDGASTLSG